MIAAIAPTPGGHRLLHELAAQVHQADRVGERERAGRDQRRVLAERVARRRRRARAPVARSQHAQRRDAGGQDRRLRVGGERQLLLGPLEAELRQREAERGVGLVEHRRAPRARRRASARAHADLLRALAREQERERRTPASPPHHRRGPGEPAAQRREQEQVARRLILPCSTASSSAIGTDADEVLPYLSMLRRSASSGCRPARTRPRGCAGWPGARPPRSTSSAVRPLASSAVCDADGHVAHRVLVDLAPVHLHEVALGGQRLAAWSARGCRRPGCRGSSARLPSA